MRTLSLVLFSGCTPVAPDVVVYVDTVADTDAADTDTDASVEEPACPEPPACVDLPLYCGGYGVELCDDDRGLAAYVPEATPSAFWCHNGDCSSGITLLMQWCSESFGDL
jgi:hypothetical protein